MAGLRHPNLCPVYEVSLDSDIPFLVMQWIDGLPLRSAWRGMTLKVRLAMFIQLLEAVAEMHGRNLVHGDLKPENIMLDHHAEPIVVDFGLARWSHQRGGLRGGTPGYAAPELLRPGEAIHETADVYALGMMMYEMLTGRLPYQADSLSEMLRIIEENDPPLPEEFAPDAPWPLQRICLVAIERDPKQRYVDAEAMLEDVRRYLRGETVAARPSILMNRFAERIEQQLIDVESWHRQGLITERENNRLVTIFRGLLQPDSHWILDARRLSISQVSLYLGGWLVLIAMSIGMAYSWSALDAWPPVRYMTACSVAASLILLGFYLQYLDYRRVSLGFQITGCLLSPIAAWLLLREKDWLGHAMIETTELVRSKGRAMAGEVSQEWFDAFTVPIADPAGLFNRQVLIIALAWLIISGALRAISRSSAFTPWIVIAFGVVAAAGWASAGMLSNDPRDHAIFGLWMAIIGLIGIAPGLYTNTREEMKTAREGRVSARRYDSWAILGGALLFLLVGMSLMAWNAGDLYVPWLADDPMDPSTRAAAFIINGLGLQIISLIITARHRTVVRVRMAEMIRWISPSHLLAGLAVLQVEAHDWWLLWLVLLAIASIAFCYLSVIRQWKPFLITGLAYFAVAYVLAFREVQLRLEEDLITPTELSLLFGVLGLGLVMMLLAWQMPGWIANLHVNRWSRSS